MSRIVTLSLEAIFSEKPTQSSQPRSQQSTVRIKEAVLVISASSWVNMNRSKPDEDIASMARGRSGDTGILDEQASKRAASVSHCA
jgi:hypothetical protein